MRTEILEKISENNNFFKVSLAGMGITDDEILEIINSIKKVKPNVSVIDLDRNELSDQGAFILSNHLSDFKGIKELSLQFNNISRKGAISLFGLKKGLPELGILFHGNKIVNVREMAEIQRLALEEPPKPEL